MDGRLTDYCWLNRRLLDGQMDNCWMVVSLLDDCWMYLKSDWDSENLNVFSFLTCFYHWSKPSSPLGGGKVQLQVEKQRKAPRLSGEFLKLRWASFDQMLIGWTTGSKGCKLMVVMTTWWAGRACGVKQTQCLSLFKLFKIFMKINKFLKAGQRVVSSFPFCRVEIEMGFWCFF